MENLFLSIKCSTYNAHYLVYLTLEPNNAPNNVTPRKIQKQYLNFSLNFILNFQKQEQHYHKNNWNISNVYTLYGTLLMVLIRTIF